jgi:hypothetical protein
MSRPREHSRRTWMLTKNLMTSTVVTVVAFVLLLFDVLTLPFFLFPLCVTLGLGILLARSLDRDGARHAGLLDAED